MYQQAEYGERPAATWLIGRDEASDDYRVLYFDSRAISRIYEMSLDGRVWKMWRNNPEFSQRFEGTISEDRKSITAHWEKSANGGLWEHDFDVLYTKQS